jgi:hypothetical protein
MYWYFFGYNVFMSDKGKDFSRRDFLKFAGVGIAGSFLASCGLSPTNQEITEKPSSEDFSFLESMIREGKNLQSSEDKTMLDEPPFFDLTYFDNPAVKQIRTIDNTQARVLATVGWLDVTNSKRYSSGLYTCNTYALDATRLLLGNDVIGSSYDPYTGALGLRGKNEPELPDNFLFLHANNISKFMSDYGVNMYGWKQITTKNELNKVLEDESIIMGASSLDSIEKGGEEYIGHSFVLFGVKDNIILSQSTTNIEAEVHHKDDLSNSKLVPENNLFSFWAHTLSKLE